MKGLIVICVVEMIWAYSYNMNYMTLWGISKLLVIIVSSAYQEISFFHNCKVPDGKGLISGVAQRISLGTLQILIKQSLGYQKHQRKKLYPTKPGSSILRGVTPALHGVSDLLVDFWIDQFVLVKYTTDLRWLPAQNLLEISIELRVEGNYMRR